jgi:hypothetical protein
MQVDHDVDLLTAFMRQRGDFVKVIEVGHPAVHLMAVMPAARPNATSGGKHGRRCADLVTHPLPPSRFQTGTPKPALNASHCHVDAGHGASTDSATASMQL